MQSDLIQELTHRVECIDGEEVYIIEKDMFQEIDKLKKMIELHKESSVYELLGRDLKFVCSHSDFAIIFRPIKRKDSKMWLPCLAYKFQNEWRRVIRQQVHCLECDWKGKAASPMDPDLYITMENWFEILQKLGKLEFCKCPKCGNSISTRAIWIEDDIE